ncbi:hypothetical protein TgHK011_003188 [Trichoderma gracile]|nr:hypothetical protein TgHK011_003188 [Trichoderma gracile]
MATDTETLSLPTTTAPTEVAASTCLPHDEHQCRGIKREWCADEWDTGIATSLHFPAQLGGPSNSATSSQHQTQQPQQQQQQQDQGGDATATGKSVEEACKRSLEHFPCPSVSFAMPTLEFDFRIAVALNPEPSRIENRVQKEITTIKGGRWSGSFGNGRVMAGGYDLGQARGFRPIRIVEGAFVLQTTDQPPAMLEMRTRGSLSGPCDVLDTLLSARETKDNIDPRQYGFRTFATVKTADKRYAEFVNCGLWVASGVWRGEELIIDAYRLT